MIKRLVAIPLALFVMAASCANNPKPNANLNPTHEMSAVRADVLNRSVAWIMDTVPVVRFNKFFVWGAYHLQIEACSGLTREGWPDFFVAPIAPLGYLQDGRPRWALYSRADNAIVFGLSFEGHPSIVMHELLHFLNAPYVAPAPPNETEVEMIVRTHPDSLFDKQTGKCGHLVHE